MTSKISSAKLLKESVKRSMAFLVLMELLYFCYFAVGSLLYLQITPYFGKKNLTEDLLVFGALNPLLLMGACVLAGILAMIQFSYLHNREKTDFYHSLPVRREKFFGIQYMAGILIWLVVYSVNAALFLLICLIRGLCSVLLVKTVLISILVQLVCFLLVYSLMILVMMLTGKLFAAIIGFGIICIYAPAVGGLLNWMMGTYFSTYSPLYGIIESPVVCLTPIYAIAKAGGFIRDHLPGDLNDLPQITLPMDYILGISMAAALVTAFCIWLYRRRSSEAAGKTMAFASVARGVKFLLVLPMSLALQLLFYTITYENAVWGFFGLLFGLLVFSAAIEFVYTMDIREVFRDRGQMLFTAAVAIVIVAVFQFDLTGYDKWLPVKSEVQEAEVEPGGYLSQTPRSIYTTGGTAGKDRYYIWEQYSEEERYTIQDMDVLYEILEQSEEFSGDGTAYYAFADEYQIPLQVIWRLENGTVKTRRYTFSEEKLSAYFGKIWDSQEFQEAMHPILKKETAKLLKIAAYSYNGNNEYRTAEFTEKNRKEFLETFCEELRRCTISQALAGAETRLELFYSDESGTIYSESFELYKGAFPKTIKLLEKDGYLNIEAE